MAYEGDQSQDRVSTIEVNKGLFVLRYTEGGDVEARNPVGLLRPMAGFENAVEIMSFPGLEPGLLDMPGAAIAVRADGPAKLQLIIRRRTPDGGFKASFSLDPLRTAPAPMVDVPVRPAATVGSSGASVFVRAHVSRRGDIEAAQGEWVGGPNAPSPIEGIEFHCALGDVDVEAQVLVAGEWSSWRAGGTFLGTRGRAIPICGVRLRLAGAASDRFALEADGLFLGSPIMSRKGAMVELVSSAGGDPLVGLRFGLRAIEGGIVASLPQADAMRAPRVRVFRAAS